jgi:hypothetical protein
MCNPQCDRVISRDDDDRDRSRCGLGGQGAGPRARHHHVGLERNQFLGQRGHAFRRAVAIPKRQRRVASLQIAEIAQPGSKPRNVARRRCGREGRENADQRGGRLLLRARRERPSGCRATKQGDELAPPHGVYPKARDHGVTIAGPRAVHRSKSGQLMSELGRCC